MAIRAACPACNKIFNLADQYLGKRVRCTNCHEAFDVGGDDEPPAQSNPVPLVKPEPIPTPRTARPTAAEELGAEGGQGIGLRRTARRVADTEADDLAEIPLRKPKKVASRKSSGPPMALFVGIGLGVLVVVGCVVTAFILTPGKGDFKDQQALAKQEGKRPDFVFAVNQDPPEIPAAPLGKPGPKTPPADEQIAQEQPKKETDPADGGVSRATRKGNSANPGSGARSNPGAASSGRNPKAAAELDRVLRQLQTAPLNNKWAPLVHLAQMEPIEEFRGPTAKIIEPFVASPDKNLHTNAVRALAKWATVEQVPTLIPLLAEADFGVRWQVLDAMLRLKDARAAEAVVRCIATDQMKAIPVVRAIGTPCEPFLLPYLQTANIGIQKDVCDILRDSGTSKSLTALDELAKKDRGFVGKAAMQAAKAIRNRDGQ